MRVYPNNKEGSKLVSNIFGTAVNELIHLLSGELHLHEY